MIEKKQDSRKEFSADWLMRGALARIGSAVDKLTGREWTPSSSLATSGLVERLKKLLDAEAKDVPGKGRVVPHNIKLKMQWDKFATDKDESLGKLETELLAAAADHINDSLYYTFAPLQLEVKTDYFTEGVKFFVSYENFNDEEKEEAGLDVTLPGIRLTAPDSVSFASASSPQIAFTAQFTLNGVGLRRRLEFSAGERKSIGRTGGNDLVIDDPSVSKIHASLAVNGDGLAVADTGSTNGTFVNDRRISYGKATPFLISDVVKFGTVEVTFERHALESTEQDQEEPDQTSSVDLSPVASGAGLPPSMTASKIASDTVKIEPSGDPAE